MHPLVVADALSQLSTGSVDHVANGKKEVMSDVHRLGRLGCSTYISSKRGLYVSS